MHKQQGWPQAWEYSQAKLIQTLGRASQGVDWSWSQCIKSHHAQTSSGKGLPNHFWNRDNVRSILPGLWRKTTGLLLSGPKSSFQMKVNFAFHLEIKVPESGGRVERHRIHVAWSPVWSFHSQWWFGLPCHLLVLSTVFSEVHSQRSHLPGNFSALHASFCWQALWRCWFHFPAGLGTCPHCQRYTPFVFIKAHRFWRGIHQGHSLSLKTSCWLNVSFTWNTKVETLQEFRSRHRIGWIIQDFRETCVLRSLTFCLETKMLWRQAPSRKKKAVVFTTVMTSAYQDQLHAGFSKVCEIFKIRGI